MTAALLAASCIASPAAVIDWAGGTSVTWATGTNWTGSAAPANDLVTDIAEFNLGTYNGTVSAPFSPNNQSTRSVAGIQIGSSSGALTIATTGTLSVGANGITMASGAAATTIGGATAAVAQTWTNNSSNRLNVSNTSYTGTITFAGTGQIDPNKGAGSGGAIIDGADVITVSSTTSAFGTGTVTLKSGTMTGNANRAVANVTSIIGDFTFASYSTGSAGLSSAAVKTTVGDRIFTFTSGTGSAATNSFHFTGGAISLGGNLEIRNVQNSSGGALNADMASGLDLNGADRILTLSQVAGSTTIGLLNLNGGNLTIAGAGTTATSLNGGFNTNGVAHTITFDNSGTGAPTLSGALTGTASTLTLAGASTNAKIGALTGGTAHAIEVNSTTGGSFGFNGASTYTGGTTITSGIATASTVAGVAGTSGPLGTGATNINGGRLDSTFASALLGSSSVTLNWGELRGTVTNALVTNPGSITLNGGILRGFGAASTSYGGGAFNVTGNTTVINDRSTSGAGVNDTFGTSLTLGGSQLDVTSTASSTSGTATSTFGAGTLTGNGVIHVTNGTAASVLALTSLGVTGTGNAIASGTGNITVSGVTTIGGGSAGSLAVNGLLTSGVALSSNGTLGGTGTIAGTVTTASTTSTLAPGNSPGTLNATALNAANGADFKFELGPTSGGGVSDSIALTGLFTGSTAANGLVFDFTSLGAVAGTPYTLVSFGTSSSLDYTDLFVTPSGFTLDSFFGTGGFLISSGSLQVQFSAVPEPSTWALLVGGSAMLLFRRRNRRKAR